MSYRLTGRPDVTVRGVKILKGECISDDIYNDLDERRQMFFEKVAEAPARVDAKQAKPRPGKRQTLPVEPPKPRGKKLPVGTAPVAPAPLTEQV